MSDKTTLAVSYDGSALQHHAMDVRDLAPALLALSHLFSSAAKELNDGKSEVSVRVKSIGAGSVLVDFELQQSLKEIIGMLTGQNYFTAAANLITVVTGTLCVLKLLKGKKPERIKKQENGDSVLWIDGKEIIVPDSHMRLLLNIEVRQSIQEALAPMEKDGIDDIKFKDSKTEEVLFHTDKPEYHYYLLPAAEERKLFDHNYTAAFTIVSISFKDKNKWRLSTGDTTIHATVSDEDFLQGIDDNNISFTKGDVLTCEMRMLQYETIKGDIRTEYELLKVIEHRPGEKQLRLC